MFFSSKKTFPHHHYDTKLKMAGLNNSRREEEEEENKNKYNPANNGERKTECEIVGQWRPGGGGRRERPGLVDLSYLCPPSLATG